MDQEVILRVTLLKLRLLESVTRYSRALVSISFGKLSKILPNPRFITNKQASFYRQRLELTNKTTQKAFIKVFGIKNSQSEMEEIASEHIYVPSIKENRTFVLSNSKIKLEYEATVLKNYSDSNLEMDDEESKTEIALDTERLSNGIHFEPTHGIKRASTVNMGENWKAHQDEEKTRDKSPLLSEKEFKHAHDTLTNYKEHSNQQRQYDDLWNNRSQINFLEPITHTPPHSPRESRNIVTQKEQSKQGQNEKEKEKDKKVVVKCQKTEQNKPVKKQSVQSSGSFLPFLVIPIISFLLGMLAKQTL